MDGVLENFYQRTLQETKITMEGNWKKYDGIVIIRRGNDRNKACDRKEG